MIEISPLQRLKVVLKKILSFLSWLLLLDLLVKKIAPKSVFIFCYHRVVTNYFCEDFIPFLSVSQDDLRDHMRYIKSVLNVFSLNDALRFIQGKNIIKQDIAVITFDDGYRDNLSLGGLIFNEFDISPTIFITTECIEEGKLLIQDRLRVYLYSSNNKKCIFKDRINYPLLRDYHRIKTVRKLLKRVKRIDENRRLEFIKTIKESLNSNTAYIESYCAGSNRLMLNWEEVLALKRMGVEIGSHTHTHQILTNLDDCELRKQLSYSKNLIEKRTKIKCQYFAYPNGDKNDFDERSISVLKNLGYKCAVSLIFGSNLPGSDPFKLKRIPITLKDDINDIRFKIFRARLKIIFQRYMHD